MKLEQLQEEKSKASLPVNVDLSYAFKLIILEADQRIISPFKSLLWGKQQNGPQYSPNNVKYHPMMMMNCFLRNDYTTKDITPNLFIMINAFTLAHFIDLSVFIYNMQGISKNAKFKIIYKTERNWVKRNTYYNRKKHSK